MSLNGGGIFLRVPCLSISRNTSKCFQATGGAKMLPGYTISENIAHIQSIIGQIILTRDITI